MGARRVMTRSGGRTEANRLAVAQAALQLISEGRLLFDVQDVADLSGVHRTTIRRRWPDRDALLAEAMAEHTSRLAVVLTGDWRRVLRRIAFALRDFMNDPIENALNRLLAMTDSEDFIALVVRQWSALFDDLAVPFLDAQKRGAIRKDADVRMVVLTFASTMLTLNVYNRRAPSDATVERLVKQALRGMKPRAD
jgi:AcrR family transcriptional regulator